MENMKSYGLCDSEIGRIDIRDMEDTLLFKDVLIHEILHAIWWEYKRDEKDDEERTVNAMASGITQVLSDNPKLASYLLSK